MQVTLETIENSKIYVNPKLEGVPFKHPIEYFHNFLEATKGLGQHFYNVEVGSKNLDVDGRGENTAFSRIAVICKIPNEMNIDDRFYNKHVPQIGMLYALDTQKPVIKVFTGTEVSACTNTCVFGASSITEAQIIGSLKPIDEAIKKYVDTNEGTIVKIQQRIQQLVERQYSDTRFDELIGQMIQFGIRNNVLGTQPIMTAIQDMLSPKSTYFAKDKTVSGWIAYNAVTDALKKASIIDVPTKVRAVEDLFFPLSDN